MDISTHSETDAQQTLGTAAAGVGDVGPDRNGLQDETATKAIDRAHLPLSGLEDDPEFANRETFHGLYVATEEEKRTLRRVAGKMPSSCYYLCAVEFAERASYYGCFQVYKQFIRAPLPPGSTTGRTPPGTRFNPGALGLGSQVATAMFVYLCSPLFLSKYSLCLSLTFKKDRGIQVHGIRVAGVLWMVG